MFLEGYVYISFWQQNKKKLKFEWCYNVESGVTSTKVVIKEQEVVKI